MPCTNATPATETRGASHSRTTALLYSAVYVRRPVRFTRTPSAATVFDELFLASTIFMVDTILASAQQALKTVLPGRLLRIGGLRRLSTPFRDSRSRGKRSRF